MQKTLIGLLVSVFVFFGCSSEDLFQDSVRHNLWLIHKGADLPVVVEGNTNSKVFLLMLHGGPGGSSQEFNAFNQPFTDILEEEYALVYYDQREAGISRGEYDETFFTIDQHIEDLEKVIELLNFQFGNDIQIFLSGHSWGGYLGTAYLLTHDNQNNVKAWINMDGQINRNTRNHDIFTRIPEIANERIALNSFSEEWMTLLEDNSAESQLNIDQYNVDTESTPISLMIRCENIIFKSELLPVNVSSTFKSTYNDNYHPFITLANNQSIDPLLNEMYNTYDAFIDDNLSNIVIPTISIYGKYDIRTPKQQGEYLINNISTLEADKKMVIIDNAGHAPMRNQPETLAAELISWIEKYK